MTPGSSMLVRAVVSLLLSICASWMATKYALRGRYYAAVAWVVIAVVCAFESALTTVAQYWRQF